MNPLIIRIKFLTVCICLMGVNCSLAEEIVILGNGYKIPKIYLEEGEPRGILIDIADYVDQQMEEYTFKFQLYPWPRAYQGALRERGGIIGLSKTRERLAVFDYSDPVFYDDVIIVVKRGREFSFNTITDLENKVVGIGRGGSFGDDFEQGKRAGLFIVEEDNGPISRLRKVLAGRLDCALLSPGISSFYQLAAQDDILSKRIDDFVILPKPFKRDPNFLGFKKSLKMQPFLQEFNQVLKTGYENGIIQRIIDKHYLIKNNPNLLDKAQQ